MGWPCIAAAPAYASLTEGSTRWPGERGPLAQPCEMSTPNEWGALSYSDQNPKVVFLEHDYPILKFHISNILITRECLRMVGESLQKENGDRTCFWQM